LYLYGVGKQPKYRIQIEIDRLTNSIKEPEGVDLLVEPSLLTSQERKRISEIIAHFKATGKKITFQKSKGVPRGKKKRGSNKILANRE